MSFRESPGDAMVSCCEASLTCCSWGKTVDTVEDDSLALLTSVAELVDDLGVVSEERFE